MGARSTRASGCTRCEASRQAYRAAAAPRLSGPAGIPRRTWCLPEVTASTRRIGEFPAPGEKLDSVPRFVTKGLVLGMETRGRSNDPHRDRRIVCARGWACGRACPVRPDRGAQRIDDAEWQRPSTAISTGWCGDKAPYDLRPRSMLAFDQTRDVSQDVHDALPDNAKPGAKTSASPEDKYSASPKVWENKADFEAKNADLVKVVDVSSWQREKSRTHSKAPLRTFRRRATPATRPIGSAPINFVWIDLPAGLRPAGFFCVLRRYFVT